MLDFGCWLGFLVSFEEVLFNVEVVKDFDCWFYVRGELVMSVEFCCLLFFVFFWLIFEKR